MRLIHHRGHASALNVPSIRSNVSLWLAFLVVLSCLRGHGAHADNFSNPVAIYRSRPDLFAAPILTVVLSEREKLAPGYFFVAPYQQDNAGPYIYDNDGNLVWSGWGMSGAFNAHMPHVCTYRNAPHLCFFQGNQQLGYSRGHGVILNNHYQIVKSVNPGGGMSSSDQHEFALVGDGSTALMTIYQQRAADLTDYGVVGMGYVMESIFQEVEVETGKVIFEWKSLDHVPLSHSWTPRDSLNTAGTGLLRESPWDYFHINSITKTASDNYIISARHTNAIYCISRIDGSILWSVNGEKSSFTMVNFPTEAGFSHQHDARIQEETADGMLLSLFNNGGNGENNTAPYSSGMLIRLDYRERTATFLREFRAPDQLSANEGDGLFSGSQGNAQFLRTPDGELGNVVQGWGNNVMVTEHLQDGTPIFYAYLAFTGTMNYRAYKFHWDADPLDIPALWAYSPSGSGSNWGSPHSDASSLKTTTFYASWNGATRVAWWRFHATSTPSDEGKPKDHTLFVDVNIFETKKRGFETTLVVDGYWPYVFVEALDSTGRSLANSSIMTTFVPGPELSSFCGDAACTDAQTLVDEAADPIEGEEQYGSGTPGRRRRVFLRILVLCGVVATISGFLWRRWLRSRNVSFGPSTTAITSTWKNFILSSPRLGGGSGGIWKKLRNSQDEES